MPDHHDRYLHHGLECSSLVALHTYVAFRAAEGGIEHLAMLVGDPEGLLASGEAPLARIHSECFTGDLLGSLRCDCGPQLQGALHRMAEAGAGVLLYLAQEGRGIGLVNKLRAYALQDQGLDTLDANRALGYGADERNFLVAGTMLQALGIPRVRLLTNNPDKLAGLAACGIEVVARRVAHARLLTTAVAFAPMVWWALTQGSGDTSSFNVVLGLIAVLFAAMARLPDRLPENPPAVSGATPPTPESAVAPR